MTEADLRRLGFEQIGKEPFRLWWGLRFEGWNGRQVELMVAESTVHYVGEWFCCIRLHMSEQTIALPNIKSERQLEHLLRGLNVPVPEPEPAGVDLPGEGE